MRRYQLGGFLPPHNPNYVEREADPYLYEKLKAGPCTVIDLLLFGSSITKKAFYKGVAEEMFRLTEQDEQIFNTWWNSYPSSDYSGSKLTLDPPQPERVSYSNTAKLKTFLEEVLLKSVQEKMFIFIDEIDMLLRYTFTHDDFF
ncbi:MAG: hypothetical protein GDA44_00315 [Prochloron sp. SP5CPC1]|nr:hypothetical protein [Candidatus Paraprochloron terpiosi SP5CPC1]